MSASIFRVHSHKWQNLNLGEIKRKFFLVRVARQWYMLPRVAVDVDMKKVPHGQILTRSTERVSNPTPSAVSSSLPCPFPEF